MGLYRDVDASCGVNGCLIDKLDGSLVNDLFEVDTKINIPEVNHCIQCVEQT